MGRVKKRVARVLSSWENGFQRLARGWGIFENIVT
jgi:hypothetical protein